MRMSGDRLRFPQGREAARVETELSTMQQLADLTIAEINEDVGWGRRDRARWAEQLDLLESRARELSLDRRRIDSALERLQLELKDLRALLGASSKLDSAARADLVIELLNPGERGRSVELRVDYLVPGALWRPWHTAQLIEPTPETGGEARVVASNWNAALSDIVNREG